MLKAENLVKNYGRHRAVDNISFEFVPGKVYGLLGVNGAGKSTTMNMITGYLAPSGGRVSIDETDIFKKPEKAKAHIGYLPEQPPLYIDMTVREYLCFVAELKKIKKKKTAEEVLRVMNITGLVNMEGRLIRNLSKGYRQRVGLAQALVGDPEIIILDEPTVGLDPKQIIAIRSLIRELGRDHAVVLSSHILSEVRAVCDEIIIISKGVLVADGTPETLEKLAGDEAKLTVTVRGSKDRFEALLKDKLSAPEHLVTKEGEDIVRAEISMGDRDIREELFYALSEARMPIMELSVKHASLEEVFLELTDAERVVKEGEGADDNPGDKDDTSDAAEDVMSVEEKDLGVAEEEDEEAK